MWPQSKVSSGGIIAHIALAAPPARTTATGPPAGTKGMRTAQPATGNEQQKRLRHRLPSGVPGEPGSAGERKHKEREELSIAGKEEHLQRLGIPPVLRGGRSRPCSRVRTRRRLPYSSRSERGVRTLATAPPITGPGSRRMRSSTTSKLSGSCPSLLRSEVSALAGGVLVGTIIVTAREARPFGAHPFQFAAPKISQEEVLPRLPRPSPATS